jgi:hypothetical protein
MKCDGCPDLLNDRLGMTRCQLALGKPTDDIKVCVSMKKFVKHVAQKRVPRSKA